MNEDTQRVGIVLNDDAALANVLRGAGVEIGSVGGENFRRHVARAILESGWFAARVQAARADAWDEGHRFTGYEPEHGENPYRAAAVLGSPGGRQGAES